MKRLENFDKRDFEINNSFVKRFIRGVISLPRQVYYFFRQKEEYLPINPGLNHLVPGLDKSPEMRERYERYHRELLERGPTRLE
ncbi:hypothetical protein HYT25_00455 [Candidatus Pacearchaeota archaeon]|nr:hypothetical protein [Candidatus Pacearchaeota archaeon]